MRKNEGGFLHETARTYHQPHWEQHLPYTDPVQVYLPVLLTPQLTSGDGVCPAVHTPYAGWQPTPQKSLVVPQKPVFEQHLPAGQEPRPGPQLFLEGSR
jgi:hypothetical protein